MVTLTTAQASNERIATDLRAGMVAVFVGATSGIGENTLKKFARHAKSPRVYLVGQSQDSADRIVAECTKLNPDGVYTFIRANISLLNNVDKVCDEILSKEDAINILFQTQGGLLATKTAEGLRPVYSLPFASRILFSLKLLPAIRRASGLRRVVSVFAGSLEGAFDENDWVEYGTRRPLKSRGHLASMITMAHNVMSRLAPDVSFIHNFPGAVKTNFGKDATGFMTAARFALVLLGPLFLKYRSGEDSAALQLYCATSAAFPPSKGDANGVSLPDKVSVTAGSDGKPGTGSYNIGEECEKAAPQVEALLAKARKDGAEEKLWEHILQEIRTITGQEF